MNKIPTPDSTGGLESSEPAERALARAIAADAIDRYLEATRARIVPFVDEHFSFTGAWALHRRALGRDLLRAPVNVMLVLPQVALLPAGAALARRAGWRRGADWLGSRQLLRETDVAREIAWLPDDAGGVEDAVGDRDGEAPACRGETRAAAYGNEWFAVSGRESDGGRQGGPVASGQVDRGGCVPVRLPCMWQVRRPRARSLGRSGRDSPAVSTTALAAMRMGERRRCERGRFGAGRTGAGRRQGMAHRRSRRSLVDAVDVDAGVDRGRGVRFSQRRLKLT